MDRSKICKASIAFAVCCAIICGVAIAPLIVSIILALVALICLLCCVLVFIIGGFVWLFTVGQVNIFDFGRSLADFGLGLFNFMSPVAQFSLNYITPIAGGIAIGLGILGIIFSSVGISRAKLQKQSSETDESGQLPPSTATTDVEAADTDKKKIKKKKTEKGACVASLAVSIVFSVLAIIAIAASVIALSAGWI